MTRIANAAAPEQEADEIEITPAALAEFEEMYRTWQRSWPVCDQLAIGATPDLESLARMALNWGKRVA